MKSSVDSADLTVVRVVNPTMVTLARESRSLTQSALATRVGVGQSMLSQVEGGRTGLSGELLARLAEVLDYPESFFLQPYEHRNLPVTFFRKRVRVPQRQLDEVQARINILRFRVAALLADVELGFARPLPTAEAGQTRSAADVARELRIAWHLRAGPIENLLRLIESAGIFVVALDFQTDLISGISMYQPQDGLPPFIFVSSTIPGDRLRWTLAHELGHLILHSHQPIPDEKSEAQADEFAAEFLMPARDIRGELAGMIDLRVLAALKPRWGTSMSALLMRAEKVGSVTKGRARGLWIAMNRYGYRRHEPVSIESERPSLMRRLLDHHLDRGRSEAWLRDQMHIARAEFRDQFARHQLVAV